MGIHMCWYYFMWGSLVCEYLCVWILKSGKIWCEEPLCVKSIIFKIPHVWEYFMCGDPLCVRIICVWRCVVCRSLLFVGSLCVKIFCAWRCLLWGFPVFWDPSSVKISCVWGSLMFEEFSCEGTSCVWGSLVCRNSLSFVCVGAMFVGITGLWGSIVWGSLCLSTWGARKTYDLIFQMKISMILPTMAKVLSTVLQNPPRMVWHRRRTPKELPTGDQQRWC